MKDVLIITLMCLGIFGGILSCAVKLDEYNCNLAWESSGRPVKWGMFSGCQVNDGKGWLPSKNYRSF